MILGNTCTRGCAFCAVGSGEPGAHDGDEPRRAARAVKAMGLNDVVITSVTRDDMADGGAEVWATTVREVKDAVPGICVEVLVPDFGGDRRALTKVFAARPDVLGHNLETVRGLYPKVRPGADYERSLNVLRLGREARFITKTGIMVGLGETTGEVAELMADTVRVGVDIFTVGQYLQPTRDHLPVDRYVEPAEFETYRERGLELGLKVVVSAPLVRSSYHSDEQEEFLRGKGTGCPASDA